MIEPFPPGTDYFAALGLSRRLQLDQTDLERRYHDLSRRYHPDFFQKAPARERLISLENASLVNKAYRALRDPMARAEYLVRLEAGGVAEARSEAPRALFDEILEFNELLSDYQSGDVDEQVALRPQLTQKQFEFTRADEALRHRLTAELFPAWDGALDVGEAGDRKTALLAEIARLISDRAYLRRVLNHLDEALTNE